MSPWPSELSAHVVTPGPDPRLHGYSVERDVARHGGFSELVLLSLRGTLPNADECRAFEVALTFLGPLSIAEALTHAAALARICGARSSAILAVAAATLAERARHTLARYAPLLAWLDEPSPAAFPVAFAAACPDERASVERLAGLLPRGVELPALRCDPDRTAALVAVLHHVGLRRPEQIEAVFVLASLAPALAEAFARDVGSFRDYPMELPRFEYTEAPDGR